MARPLRIEFPGGLYHVTSRGDRREAIYKDDADRSRFLEVLGEVAEIRNWVCHAYCCMTNHYHLVVQTPDGNLSKGMRQLNGVFTQYSNRRHAQVGHLFQGRYKAILVDEASYLLIDLHHQTSQPTAMSPQFPDGHYLGQPPRFMLHQIAIGVPGGMGSQWIADDQPNVERHEA